MMKRILISLMIFTGTIGYGAEVGQWGIAGSGTYSIPVSDLSNWFKPAQNFSIGIGQQYNDLWYIEGSFEYSRYARENLTGYPNGRLDLELRHAGIYLNGRYQKAGYSVFKPYFLLSAGILYWQGTRGAIQANDSLGIPQIDKKVLDEMNWGFRGGVGLEVYFTPEIAFDIFLDYRLIIGMLYPTMQQHIELDGVNGFQTGNITLAFRYYF